MGSGHATNDTTSGFHAKRQTAHRDPCTFLNVQTHRVPDRADYDPFLGATLTTGEPVAAATAAMPAGPVALDTETPSITDAFTHRCITAAWWEPDGRVRAVLLDPRHREADAVLCREIVSRATSLIFHNAPFDVPGLWAAGLLDRAAIEKITDTLVSARLAWPDQFTPKSLSALASRCLGWSSHSGGMDTAFRAAGYTTRESGYAAMDITSPIYRIGALTDTVATLRLEPLLRHAAVDRLLRHPFTNHGCTDPAAAQEVWLRQQRVNRVMLRRNAIGLSIDTEYLEQYRERVADEAARSAMTLRASNIRPGVGADLLARLDSEGAVPPGWPRTATGKLSSAKAHLDTLDHPLAAAHRNVAHTAKIDGYLEKVTAASVFTGRLHPQCGILGASATGRMSFTSPELQQFPAEARPIIVSDKGTLTSVDWSQIEPVMLANLAGDQQFLAPFESGADLYEPIQRAAGVSRKVAKVVLLAAMYGQGERKLARTISATTESAAQIRRQMFAAMPACAVFMSRISAVAQEHRLVVTVGGRILTIPEKDGMPMSYVGVNRVIQGSASDLLTDALLAIEDAGLGDAIVLPMHDEIVCDTPASEQIEKLIQQPPESLCRWADRVPVLRTDRNVMGRSWSVV